MDISIIAIIFSGIATAASVAAVVISLISRKKDITHYFYSNLEENISSIIFEKYPKALNEFINITNRQVINGKYDDIDDCFADLYFRINCLDYLNEKQFERIKEAISNLEDSLMFIKNHGYDDDKIKLVFKKNKEFYSIIKKFTLTH